MLGDSARCVVLRAILLIINVLEITVVTCVITGSVLILLPLVLILLVPAGLVRSWLRSGHAGARPAEPVVEESHRVISTRTTTDPVVVRRAAKRPPGLLTSRSPPR